MSTRFRRRKMNKYQKSLENAVDIGIIAINYNTFKKIYDLTR